MIAAEALRHWVREREAMRIRKESGAPMPWTDDPILAKYRFCNVRREDDRVTVWIRRNIRERFAGLPNLWFMLAIGRWINWPDTLQEIIAGLPSDPQFVLPRLCEILAMRQARGEKVFTGAYTINAPATKGASKIDYVVKTVLGEPWRDRLRIGAMLDGSVRAATLRDTHIALSKYQGWGAFMAYQVVVDMRFTALLRGADDVETWAAAGPGTVRGLNRIAGRATDFALPQWRALAELRTLYETIRQETGVEMDFSDVPNILCETDKYLRVLNGEGAPRALYRPANNVGT
ncbi:MAG TPA: nucleotide kinase domain-containing protein [Rhizomicrobium sp.]|jgi:hypothetical protein